MFFKVRERQLAQVTLAALFLRNGFLDGRFNDGLNPWIFDYVAFPFPTQCSDLLCGFRCDLICVHK
jgi:hypothetical protein